MFTVTNCCLSCRDELIFIIYLGFTFNSSCFSFISSIAFIMPSINRQRAKLWTETTQALDMGCFCTHHIFSGRLKHVRGINRKMFLHAVNASVSCERYSTYNSIMTKMGFFLKSVLQLNTDFFTT